MFDPVRHSVPGGSAQRICVHRRARSFWSDTKPAEWWPRVLIHESKPIVRKQIWNLVIVHQRPDVAIIIHVRLEKIQRTIILLVPDIICVIFELHPKLLTFVVLRDLEGHMPETLFHSID